MSVATCDRCGEVHDLAEMEPSYVRPDPLLDIPQEEWPDRARVEKDWCQIRGADHGEVRHFLRVLLPVPVAGREIACSWGVWVELTEPAFERVRALWDEDDQHTEPPFAVRLVNELAGFPDTTGLPGEMRLISPKSIPVFHLRADVAHPLAAAQRDGVDEATALRWADMHVHG
jgi:hypothetical protein